MRRHALLVAVAAAFGAGCPGAPKRATAPSPAPADAEALAAEYRRFLDEGRTPARAVAYTLARGGWTVIDPLADAPKKLAPGARVAFVDRDRSAIFAVVGEASLADEGARIVAAHIDTPSPRLDLGRVSKKRQARIAIHGYGGMRSHHWAHRPLAVVGRVARRGGEVVEVTLGLGDDDFALYLPLTPKHGRRAELGAVIASSMPLDEDGAASLVGVLHDRYGIDAADLAAAELYVVPAQGSREVGLDRALIGAHGQDDRANSYVAWRALADLPGAPPRTAMAWLVDREEVGSTGPTGARSQFLELVYAWLLRAEGAPATEASLGRALAATRVLSADTPAAINPNFPEVQEAQNAPRLGRGPAMFPFTGSGGKQGGSQAHAELVASVFAAFDAAAAPLQTGELGRVDEGGGGTIAKYLGARGIDVVDVGVPVVSMHSPFELTAKIDLWHGYLGFRAWLAGDGLGMLAFSRSLPECRTKMPTCQDRPHR